MCSKVDEGVGRVLESLESQGLTGNTLVIFTSEHGHYFEDEYRWNTHHKRLCYDTAANVPLLMQLPGVITPDQRSADLISAVDLVPTLLSLLDLDPVAGLQGKDLSGVFTRGAQHTGRDAIFLENFPFINKGETPGPYPNEPAWTRGEERCVRSSEWKLILSTVRSPELYHMQEDPGEVNNQWEDYRDSSVVDMLTEHLHDWAVRTGDSVAPVLITRAKYG